MTATPEVITKVRNLLALATDSDSEESRTAAKKAVTLMKEHELVLIPKSEIERIKVVFSEAQQLAKRVEGEKTQNMMLAGLAGFMFGKNGKLF